MGNYDHTLSENGFVPKEVEREKRNFFDKKILITYLKVNLVYVQMMIAFIA